MLNFSTHLYSQCCILMNERAYHMLNVKIKKIKKKG